MRPLIINIKDIKSAGNSLGNDCVSFSMDRTTLHSNPGNYVHFHFLLKDH